jgi:hypothetical protein
MLLPTAVGCAAIGVTRLVRWVGTRSRAARAPSAATLQPFERVAADARRLRSQLTELEAAEPGPGRGVRVRALRAAYVETLRAACRALEVTPPPTAPGGTVRPSDIYRVEVDLLRRGLDVRAGVVR